MIEYRWKNPGSDKWTPKDWEEFYKQFQQRLEEVPSVLGKLMHKALEYIRAIAVKNYLTKVTANKSVGLEAHKGSLHVRTGRGRASLAYKVLQASKSKIKGEVGTNVWYMAMHEEGGIFQVQSKAGAMARRSYVMKVPKRAWLEPSVKKSLPWISNLFEKAGIQFIYKGKRVGN